MRAMVLKPVHRRVLYAMQDLATRTTSLQEIGAYCRRCHRQYHPHGDSAVYDTMVRLVQDSLCPVSADRRAGELRFPSTETVRRPCAIPKSAWLSCPMSCLPISTRIPWDFGPNYDESLTEPLVLPRDSPISWSTDLPASRSGSATNVPPHNLTEIINATILLIEKPEATLDELMTRFQARIFPTAGFIYGRGGIRAAYESGRGIVIMRAKAAIEKMARDRESIVVTEIPYQVNKATTHRAHGRTRWIRKSRHFDLRDESTGKACALSSSSKKTNRHRSF